MAGKPGAHMEAMAKTYPFVIDTLGKMLEAGASLSVYCLTCKRNKDLDLTALAGRLGETFSCMHWDLVRKIYCAECRVAGREDRKLHFTHLAQSPQQRNQKSDRNRLISSAGLVPNEVARRCQTILRATQRFGMADAGKKLPFADASHDVSAHVRAPASSSHWVCPLRP